MSETATDRLARVLALVPYISRRPGVALADLAVEFGVTAEQLAADLDLLMVCGLPGYYPDDLIDVVLDEEGGTVSIAFDAGIERPVRLTSDEAVALTVALRAFADLPGLIDADAVFSALAKLEQAGAETAGAVRVAAADAAPALGAVRQAVDQSRQLWMRYYTASRDALTERIVDPIRLLVTDGHAYLEGYCHSADAVRHFRVDRMEEVRVLDEPAQGQLWVDSDVPDRVFHPDPQIPPVTLLLAPSARWVADYYLAEDVTEVPTVDPRDGQTDHSHPDDSQTDGQPNDGQPDGWPDGHPDGHRPSALRVRLRAGGDDWVVRLVLSLGGAAVILDRPDLALRVAEQAALALEAYR